MNMYSFQQDGKIRTTAIYKRQYVVDSTPIIGTHCVLRRNNQVRDRVYVEIMSKNVFYQVGLDLEEALRRWGIL